ncbi:MAG: hypothetical protein OK454_11110, partial [Thaumarchaeota archaeon]|nr:hypothetical protein [Nitrososphaerota archaeon]
METEEPQTVPAEEVATTVVEAASPADEPPAAAEFEPEEASASYRIDPSAPSEFRFAASSSSLLEEEELAPEAELSLPEPTDLRPEASDTELAAFAVSDTHPVELETDFYNEEEDLDALAPVTGLVEEEEVTDEEEYDFTPLYVESEDHDLQELEEETLDQEISVGSAIGDMVRDAHLEQRIEADASTLTVEEEEEAEDELVDKFVDGVAENEADEGQAAAAPGQPARRQREDQRRGGRG